MPEVAAVQITVGVNVILIENESFCVWCIYEKQDKRLVTDSSQKIS